MSLCHLSPFFAPGDTEAAYRFVVLAAFPPRYLPAKKRRCLHPSVTQAGISKRTQQRCWGQQVLRRRESLAPSPASACPSPAASPPSTVQQLHLSQSLCDHRSKNQPEEDTADQHVVVVVFQDIELLRRVHSGLVDVQAVGNDLKRS